MAGKIELEVISSHFGRNVFSVYNQLEDNSHAEWIVLHFWFSREFGQ
jgi:hypothetical protein